MHMQKQLIPVCRDLGIGIVCFSPLGRGFLTGGWALYLCCWLEFGVTYVKAKADAEIWHGLRAAQLHFYRSDNLAG